MRATLSGLRAPPASEDELLSRARGLAGRTLGELAAAQGRTLPASLRRAKGLVGEILERALGASAGSRSEPDFPALGIELKSVPIGADGTPRESTFVCTLPLAEVARLEWSESPVRRKLARVLFVPVEADPELPLPSRRIGTPLLFALEGDDERALRADYDELAGLAGAGHVESITAHVGRHLQLRPKAADGRARTRALDAEGEPIAVNPRGFYLRASFTAMVLARALRASAIPSAVVVARSERAR